MKTTHFENFEWHDFTKPSSEELKEFATANNLDPNLLYDSMQHGHLPKIEKLKDYTFMIFRAYSVEESKLVATIGELSNKIAFFVNGSKLITIHRANFDFLDGIAQGQANPEALMLDIIDEMVNSFSHPLNNQAEWIDIIEKNIFLPRRNTISLENLYYQTSKARICRKLMLFTQNVLGQLNVDDKNKSKLQDVKESIIHSILLYEEIYEDANNILNTYLSITAKKSNDVMRLLTVFSAFFLPLTFIVGVYGMNFENMPELKWQNGYFFVMGFIGVISLGIYIWFKRSKIL
jgi:magnesium transporter